MPDPSPHLAAVLDGRPRDDELDLFGLTHRGLVREENEDHFLLCTVQPEIVVRSTSLPDVELRRGERLATLMLVADGVGGHAAGRRASALATEAITQFIASALRGYTSPAADGDAAFREALRLAACAAHEAVCAEAAATPEQRGMATTLSLAVVVWPWLYVLQVGDSRCYVYRPDAGTLERVTRDQTVAQALVDAGALPAARAAASPLAHVLSSAIGGPEATPEVSRVDVRTRGTVILVCTDGLTKHVSDAEIAERLRAMRSAEQGARALLALALERGGRDNVTIVVGRARAAAPATGAVRAAG